MIPQNTGTIGKESVRYLSLEGGGGAGNGYSGAFKALYDLKVLKYDNSTLLLDSGDNGIKGIAGASAGAITGTLLACGFIPYELEEIMQSLDTESFFDIGVEGEIPVPGGFAIKKPPKANNTDPALKALIKKILSLVLTGAKIELAVLILPVLPFFLAVNAVEVLFLLILLIPKIISALKDLPEGLRKRLTSNIDVTVLGLYNDFGLFLGRAPRVIVHRFIRYATMRALEPGMFESLLDDVMEKHKCDYETARRTLVRKITVTASPWDDYYKDDLQVWTGTFEYLDAGWDKGISFKEFKKIFKVDLALTGTNLETKKSHIFSAKTTPDFYVEDAVRISMSLPMIFKPLFINNLRTNISPEEDAMQGIWVDGGYFNNSPINIFPPEQCVGLRLEQEDERTSINSFSDYLKTWPFGLGVFGSGEAQVSITMAKLKNFNTIILNTRLPDGKDGKKREIGLFDFKPHPDILKAVNINTEKAVIDYFKRNIPTMSIK